MLDSLNQGLVRGPARNRRVSIHSPPSRILVSCNCAHSALSVIPGSSFRRMSVIACSQTSTALRISTISSADLIARAVSMSSNASSTSMPSLCKAPTPSTPMRSTARRPLPPPYWRTRSAISAAHSLTFSRNRGPAAEVVPGRCWPHLINARQAFAQVPVRAVFEHDHGALRWHEGVTRLVMRTPDLHVGGISRITRIQLVV